MVKIPELAEDRQNWKIYRVKFLKVAATFDCLEVLAGRPYEGEDWDGCTTVLHVHGNNSTIYLLQDLPQDHARKF